MNIKGGFAWFAIFVAWLTGGLLVWVGLFGGEVSYASKGLVGWIREMRKGDEKE